MGGGSWSSVSYLASARTRAAAGIDDFHYDSAIRSGKPAAKVNDLLDPTKTAGGGSPFKGKVMREVCITTEHPNPTPIAIGLDVTGSNYAAAKIVHAKLPQLFGVLQRTGGIEDPQIMPAFI